MKPDRPGEWHSRDGRRIVAMYLAGGLCWRPCVGPSDGFFGASQRIETLESDDWLPAEPPTFPELPPKPKALQCLVRVSKNEPEWALWENGTWFVTNYHFYSRELEVVSHPDNDPEAVRMIQEAKAAK